MKEYVEIWHGKALKDLIDDGDVRGEYRSFYGAAGDTDNSKGAVFWGRIYKLVQGPGTEPGVTISNIGPPPDYVPAGDGKTVFADKTSGLPETRKDWDTILEKYRRIVRSEFGKISPQQ